MDAEKRRAVRMSAQHDNMIVVNDEETRDDEHLLDLQLCADNNEESKDKHTRESSPTAASESEKGTQQEGTVAVVIHEEKLPTSTFSLMFLAEPFSRAHIYAWAVFSVQLGIVLAAIVDNFDTTQPSNPAHFPPGSPISVTVAQAIMIPLAVAAQNDFVTGVVRLNDRKTVQVAKRSINDSHSGGGPIKFRERVWQSAWLHPGTTNSKWILSSLAQLFIGFGILVVSFVFMMQSETVFQVLVNFVALIMISNISSIAYFMAANGFLGFRVWQNTEQVTQHVVQRQYKSDAFKQTCYVLVVLAMYSGYFCVVYRQQTGFYQCRSVLVQFDDEFDPHLPYLTGRYEITTNRTHNRFVFGDDASTTHSSFSMAFCEEKEAWTISESHHEDPCQLLTASQTSSAYDVSLTGGTSWRASSQRYGSLVDTTSFLLQCTDCDETFCQPQRGTCVNNRCVCKDGRYGLHCEFQAPCEEIVLNAERGPFPAFTSVVTQDNVVPASEYRLLKGDNDTLVLAYDRPVYVSRGFEFAILFTGRRWALINPRIAILQGQEVTSATEISEEEIRRLLVAYLLNRHLYKTLTLPSVQQFTVSEAVEFGSPIDIGVPIGLNWLGVRSIRTSTTLTSVIDRLVTYDVSFVCLYCDPEGDECANLSRCDPNTRICVCQNDTVLGFPTHTGPRCEKSLTCMDVQQQSDSNTLATGCFGEEFTCMENGQCSCVEDFPDAGQFCQFLPCYSEAVQSIGGCQNNSTCSTFSGQCICDSDFFQGRFCEEEVPACFDEEALMLYPPTGCSTEGGSCNNATGFCDCPPGRAGRYCERVLARCDDALMMEIYPPFGCATTNSTCNTETGQCDCPNPSNGAGGTSMIFQGVSCEITNLACDHPDVQTIFPNCTGHGVCNTTNGFCDCESVAFDGRYCQLDVGAVVFNETENDR